MAEVYEYPPGKKKKKSFNFRIPGFPLHIWLGILALLLCYLFFRFFVTFKLDWTWFSVLGYDPVFWRSFTAKILIGAIIFGVVFFCTYMNTYFIFRNSQKPFRPLLSVLPAFLVALLLTGEGSEGNESWLQILQFIEAEPFGITDPQFNLDLGFYVFKLPIFWLVYRLVSLFLVLNILLTVPLYFFLVTGKIEVSTQYMTKRIFTREEKKAFTHIGFLLVLFLIGQAVKYKLLIYELLYSSEGAVVGAGAADLGARLPGYYIMMFFSVVLGIFIFWALRKNIKKVILAGVGYLLVAGFVLGIFPVLYQKYIIEPEELVKEIPYLQHNIDYTRMAYGLDSLTAEEYPVGEITAEEIEESRDIIDNIRLLDYQATNRIYEQQQEIRPYYDFIDVDIDRYVLDGKLTQVLLSARELNRKALGERAENFNNVMFKYTHGFGLAMSPANAVSETGLPQYIIKDIPPQVESGNLSVKEPRIYFGEAPQDNVIVNTTLKEFDYPLGDDNQEYVYQGKKGIPMTFGNKLLLAIRDVQFRYLLSDYITPESQYLETRNILERARRIAPFLLYDQDPYLVLGEDGNLYYLLDAYTVTDRYPYSQVGDEQNNFNYIRNSVKIVVNAYSGEVDFYLFDQQDPLIKVYSKIYPGLFKSQAEFPQDLREHIRYPEGLFNVQSLMLQDYHMTNPTVFFLREDRWEFGQEVYWNELQTQESFYSIIRLPGEEKEEFVLMRVFSPNKKPNMIAWLAARSDGEHYGKLLLYKFPKGLQVPGTAQVESFIGQDPEISAQLTLWGQGGNNVIRGNLLVYPLGGSLLYVEPLYIEAKQNKYPQLKKVFVYYQDSVVMEDTLQKALEKIFDNSQSNQGNQEVPPPENNQPDVSSPAETEVGTPTVENAQRLIERLIELHEQGKAKMQAGDWAGYGQVQQEMDDLIQGWQQ